MTDHSSLGGIFDMTGVTCGPDGIKRYEGLPRNLVQMFRAQVERQPLVALDAVRAAGDPGHVEDAAQAAVIGHDAFLVK